MPDKPDLIIGIDAGTSVMKAVAFQLDGVQLAVSSVKNTYQLSVNGAATQSLPQTWSDCATAIKGLVEKVPQLDERVAAIAVTGQGDGTWLLDKANTPSSDAWLWLDARAAPTVTSLSASPLERKRFEATGTGLNACQQGAQLAHMNKHYPQLLDQSATALHCKDWLYYCLTGVLATDPSEASFTFGDFRKREYNDDVIEALGLSKRKYLLPDILDGTQTPHQLSAQAARLTGLKQGTPVCLGFVDMIMTALGAGIYTGEQGVGCSAIGSTGVHMRAVKAANVRLTDEHTGYVLCLPFDDMVAQTQTNMAATLNIDWVLGLAAELVEQFGQTPTHAQMIERLDGWLNDAQPGALLYHPYISKAGERGPFINPDARAGFIGLSMTHNYANLVRSVVEGLAMAARDCYAAMGDSPKELRITGGAARSQNLRRILSAAVNAPTRVSAREEAGAAGAAMMAAVAIGAYRDMNACIAQWVTPLLSPAEPVIEELALQYEGLFPAYLNARTNLKGTWAAMAAARSGTEAR